MEHIDKQSAKLTQKDYFLVALVFVFFFALTTTIWILTSNFIDSQSEADFRVQSERLTAEIDSRVDLYLNVLSGTKGLFQASNFVDRKEFRTYISSLELSKQYPGMQGVGYSVFVSPSEKEEHIELIRSEGFDSYNIKPEGDRDIYTSIIYLEPFDLRNQQAFGYDMYSDEVRKEAMDFAIDRNQVSMSEGVTLVQEIDDDIQVGFLVYLPLYEKGRSILTLNERREYIIGFVYEVFRATDLINAVVGDQLGTEMHLEVYNADAVEMISDENRIYTSDSALILSSTGNNSRVVYGQLEAANQTWILKYTVSNQYGKTFFLNFIQILVLLVGLLVSVFATYLVYTLISSRKSTIRFASELNQTLIDEKKQLEENNATLVNKLQESESLNATLVEKQLKISSDAVAVVDKDVTK